MPGYSEKQNALATKLLTFYPENAKRNLPTHQATILLFDANNGLLKAVSDLFLNILACVCVPMSSNSNCFIFALFTELICNEKRSKKKR